MAGQTRPQRSLPVKQAELGKATIGFDFVVAFAFDRSSFVVRPYKFELRFANALFL